MNTPTEIQKFMKLIKSTYTNTLTNYKFGCY